MFNVGGPELIVIGLVALVVLGPDKLPGALRQLGSFLGELRRISSGFQTDLRAAIDEAERDATAEQHAARGASGASAPAAPPDTPTGPDPGAAMAAAQAELEAIEAASAGPAPPIDDTDVTARDDSPAPDVPATDPASDTRTDAPRDTSSDTSRDTSSDGAGDGPPHSPAEHLGPGERRR